MFGRRWVSSCMWGASLTVTVSSSVCRNPHCTGLNHEVSRSTVYSFIHTVNIVIVIPLYTYIYVYICLCYSRQSSPKNLVPSSKALMLCREPERFLQVSESSLCSTGQQFYQADRLWERHLCAPIEGSGFRGFRGLLNRVSVRMTVKRSSPAQEHAIRICCI